MHEYVIAFLIYHVRICKLHFFAREIAFLRQVCPANFKGSESTESLGSASVPLTERFRDVAGYLGKKYGN